MKPNFNHYLFLFSVSVTTEHCLFLPIRILLPLIKICTSTRQAYGYKLEETIWSRQLALVRPHAGQSRTYLLVLVCTAIRIIRIM